MSSLNWADLNFPPINLNNMPMKNELTQDKLKEYLSYDKETGFFTWIKPTSNHINPQKGVAGNLRTTDGYIQIIFNSHNYLAHRLAWLYVHGEWPKNDIDHIDGDRQNNKINNSRQATKSENLQNLKKAKKSNTSTGVLGVSYSKRDKSFRARVNINNKNVYCSYHKTLEQATIAYLIAKRNIHEFTTI